MHPPPGRLAPYLLVEVSHNACVILATMWSFFGSTRFIHLAPAAAAVSYFAHPISWPKRNVKTHGATKPVSLGREGTKIVASCFDGGF
jgi:hypothetical protein